jgi:hypothetical protein
MAARDGQHAPAPAADQQGRVRLLDRLGQPVQLLDLVVPSAEGEGSRREQALQHPRRLVEALDPHAGRGIRDARGLVVAEQPAGAKADLDPALGQHVQGGHGLVRQHRVAVVTAEHQAQHAQPLSDLGGHGHGDGGLHHPALGEVVGDRHGREPEVLDAPHRVPPASR